VRTAVWFSRHQPTAEQISGAAALGFEITGIETGKRLGAMDLRDNGDVRACLTALLAQVSEAKAAAIFGVPSTPVAAQFARTAHEAVERGEVRAGTDVPFLAAWNVQRAADGGKPTFEHREWCLVGWLSQDSLRWLV